jgi:hypothetical protein
MIFGWRRKMSDEMQNRCLIKSDMNYQDLVWHVESIVLRWQWLNEYRNKLILKNFDEYAKACAGIEMAAKDFQVELDKLLIFVKNYTNRVFGKCNSECLPVYCKYCKSRFTKQEF